MTDDEILALADRLGEVPSDASEVRMDGDTFRETLAALRKFVEERREWVKVPRLHNTQALDEYRENLANHKPSVKIGRVG